jgi:hypothetical protein
MVIFIPEGCVFSCMEEKFLLGMVDTLLIWSCGCFFCLELNSSSEVIELSVMTSTSILSLRAFPEKHFSTCVPHYLFK